VGLKSKIMKITPSIFVWALGLVLSMTIPSNASEGHHQSGITARIVGVPTFVVESTVFIVSSDGGKYMATIDADENRFEVALKPGVYTLVIQPISPISNLHIGPGVPIFVTIDKKEVKELTLNYWPQPQ
jgi:hypothetical protein